MALSPFFLVRESEVEQFLEKCSHACSTRLGTCSRKLGMGRCDG